MNLTRLAFSTWLLFCGPLAAAAQDAAGIYGVYNEGSLDAGDGIAPGSNILIFSGQFAVGPAVPQTAPTYPLVTTLAGTSVRATVGGVTVDLYVLGAETQWVRAMFPSRTPVGDGTLVVTYNGQSSVPYRLHVVERHLSIYDGSWCGPSSLPKPPSFCVHRAVQNADRLGAVTANSLTAPARSGAFVTL